jgi:hypothetical protein
VGPVHPSRSLRVFAQFIVRGAKPKYHHHTATVARQMAAQFRRRTCPEPSRTVTEPPWTGWLESG